MPRELSFVSESVNLSSEEVSYWKRMMMSNLKIGVEIECCYGGRESTSTMIQRMKEKFVPTANPSVFGKTGVYAVKSDGSLSNGVELCTVGRRLSFLDLYEQYKFITEYMMTFSPILNQRAGLHNHILLDYGQNHSCIEKPVPGIVMKNFVQLLRRHAPELIWITSTVYDRGYPQCITRYSHFCDHDTLMQYAPTSRNITNYKDQVATERYKFINFNPMSSEDDYINRFHFELRFPDGSIIPAQIAAQNILYAAMLIKAVELSEVGIISVGDDWEETRSLTNAIRNETYSSYRLSKELSEENTNLVRQRAIEFVQFIKPELFMFDTHTYMMLRSLADSPISIMRRTTEIPEINNYFARMVQSMYDSKSEEYLDIIKLINVMGVSGAYSKADWCKRAAEKLQKTQQDIEQRLFKLSMIKQTDFDLELGIVHFK